MFEFGQVVVFAASLLAESMLAAAMGAKRMLVSSGPTGKRGFELERCLSMSRGLNGSRTSYSINVQAQFYWNLPAAWINSGEN